MDGLLVYSGGGQEVLGNFLHRGFGLGDTCGIFSPAYS